MTDYESNEYLNDKEEFSPEIDDEHTEETDIESEKLTEPESIAEDIPVGETAPSEESTCSFNSVIDDETKEQLKKEIKEEIKEEFRNKTGKGTLGFSKCPFCGQWVYSWTYNMHLRACRRRR